MTKPSERDLDKAFSILADASRPHVEKVAEALASERASLPDSVIAHLEKAQEFTGRVPMDSDANLDESALHLSIAIDEIKAWQQGDHEPGEDE